MNDELIKDLGARVLATVEIVIRDDRLRKLYRELKAGGLSAKQAREEICKAPYTFLNGQKQIITERNLISILYEKNKRK